MEIFGYVLIKKEELLEKEKLLVKSDIKIGALESALKQLDKPKRFKSKHVKRKVTLKSPNYSGSITYKHVSRASKVINPKADCTWLHYLIKKEEKIQGKTDVAFSVNGYEVRSVQVGGKEDGN